jgi:hypothetical protein
MAQTYDERYFDYNVEPEAGIREVKRQRSKKSLVAAALFGIATIVTLGLVYLMYNDVPAPTNPANAEPGLLEPYR